MIVANGTNIAFVIQIFCVNIWCLEVLCYQCKVNLSLFQLILYDASVNRQHRYFDFWRLDFQQMQDGLWFPFDYRTAFTVFRLFPRHHRLQLDYVAVSGDFKFGEAGAVVGEMKNLAA